MREHGGVILFYHRYGNPNNFASSCSVPAGYVTNNLDCDDTDPMINPNATEICDGEDNNCNGWIDQEDPAIVYDIFYEDSSED